MNFGFSDGFNLPFFTGTAASALVPYKFDCAIAGRGFMLDRDMLTQASLISSIHTTRAQGDASPEPGEQSLNPDDLWRRSQQSWHYGAGQPYLDREDSIRQRFHTSKGIDPWTRGQISLLQDTTLSLSSTGTAMPLSVAGTRLYAGAGSALKYTTDLSTWSTVTGTSGSTILGTTSDGTNIWFSDGANCYVTTSSSSSASTINSRHADYIKYVKGRLLFAVGPQLWQVTNMATYADNNLWSHHAADWTWVSFTEAPGCILAAGYSGDKSYIYKITLQPEGTNLNAPSVTGELPDGERIYSMGSYLGYVFLGTSRGVRFCTFDIYGNFNIGAIIPTPYPVRCFEGQQEYVWYGLSNYDGVSGGLGRVSMRTFTDTQALKPAYASDLMVTTTNDVRDVVTFADRRVFSVSGVGVYAEDLSHIVASGTIDCGRMNWGITEKKIPLYLDAMYAGNFTGSATSYYSPNGDGTWHPIGVHSSVSDDPITDTFQVSESPVDQIEIRHVFTDSVTASGPILLRYTVRAQPVAALRRLIVLPIIMADRVETNARTYQQYDVQEELSIIEGWRMSKEVVNLQLGSESYAAAVEDFDFFASHPTTDRSFWNGTCVINLKSV
jgi:hypothetical protein